MILALELKTPTFSNTGDTKGAEVVQVYAGELPTNDVDTPEKQLAGFEKVELKAGKQKSVKIKLDPKAFSYYDETKKNGLCLLAKYLSMWAALPKMLD